MVNVKRDESAAWRENFRRDLGKITNEIAASISKKSIRVSPAIFKDHTALGISDLNDKDKDITVYLIPDGPKRGRITYEIKMNVSEYNRRQLRFQPIFSYVIPVSRDDSYSREEMERAKSSITVKIMEAWDKFSKSYVKYVK